MDIFIVLWKLLEVKSIIEKNNPRPFKDISRFGFEYFGDSE